MKEQEPKSTGPNLEERFCLQPSDQYMQLLDELGGDPRSVVGYMAIRQAGPLCEKGWQPQWDARDTRKHSRGC